MSDVGAVTRLRRGRGAGVDVAVVDSGWSPDFQDSRVLPGVDLVGGMDTDAGTPPGHGTVCALRILQVAPEARIVPIRVFRPSLETSVAVLCEGIRLACEAGARVINLSLATQLDAAVRPLFAVCEAARRRGIVIVAAAHNQHVPAVPAYLEPVLAVQEGDQTDLLDFSYDPFAPIECSATGRGVPVSARNGWSAAWPGNSIAAATMSGVVARILQHEDVNLDEVRSLLGEIAHDLADGSGHG